MRNRTVCLGVLALLLILELLAFQFKVDMDSPQLVDTDCYMRLVRVEQLHANHDWYDATIPRSNWPYGETLHWSRLLDILLLAGAYAGAFVAGFKTALFWWGMIIGPVLHVASMAALFWAASPLFGQDALVRLGFLFLGQMGIWGYYYIGRPDHHGLLLLLFIILFGFCIRMADNRYGLQNGAYAGVAAATAMWVSVEALAAVLMVQSILTVLWIGKREGAAGTAGSFSLTLLLLSMVYILIEMPVYSATAVVYDKLSIVHIAAFGLATLFWTLLRRLEYTAAALRAAATVVLAGITAAVLYRYYPGFFQGPYAGIDPRIVPIWLSKVEEVQPLFSYSRKGAADMLYFLGPMTVCLPYAVYLGITRLRDFSRTWLVYAAGMLIYIPLSFYQVRWVAYAETVLIFPWAVILQNCLQRLPAVCREPWRIWARATVTVLFCIGFLAVALAVAPAAEPSRPVTVTKAAAFLSDPSLLGAVPKTIVADVDFGPELLYRTPHRVIATPYHRNGDGILFVYQVMTARQDSEAYRLLQQRDVDLILLYPAIMENGDGELFFQRLLTGYHPTWLRPVPLPENLQGDVYLYEVLRHEQS